MEGQQNIKEKSLKHLLNKLDKYKLFFNTCHYKKLLTINFNFLLI